MSNLALRRYIPYLLFLVMTLGFLWKPIFTGRALLPGDYLAYMKPWASVVESTDPAPQWNPLHWDAISQFYPWRVFFADSIKSGKFPLSNPHQFCGTAFMANGQSACLYPFNYLLLIFNPITFFTVFAALHLFLAQVFMYWLMRELGAKAFGGIVSAIVFAFSAFMVLWLELPTFISVAIWLPLALMLIQRAASRKSVFYGMLSGAAIALAFLAGHFQIAFYVTLAAGLWWIWKIAETLWDERTISSAIKIARPVLGCAAIAALIACAQLLPSQELASHSHRVRAVTEQGYQGFIANALPVYRLVTAFVPRYFGDPSQNNYYLVGPIGGKVASAADYMEFGMYAGILPLMLAFVSLGAIRKRHISFFAGLTILALLLAAGTTVNRLLYFGVPGFSALGGPNRVLLLYSFGVAALAGFGADYYFQNHTSAAESRPSILLHSLALLAAPLFLFALTLWISWPAFLSGAPLGDPSHKSVFTAFCLIIISWLLLVECKRRPQFVWFPIFVLALIAADLFYFGINFNPTCERSKIYPDTELTNELKCLTTNGERIAVINEHWNIFNIPSAILPPNAATIYGLYDVQGYDSLFTKQYQSLLADLEGIDPSPPENGNMILVRRYTPEIASLAAYLISADPIDDANIKLINNIDDVYIYHLPGSPQCVDHYVPGTFRIGLWLMFIGVGAVACTGLYALKQSKKTA
ncbi:MAG: YfhO family protein [Armatimonadetes bacterium]|nr:YfhO family protein [Armatimonadota bacterium]